MIWFWILIMVSQSLTLISLVKVGRDLRVINQALDVIERNLS